MSTQTFQLSPLDRNPFESYVRTILCFPVDDTKLFSLVTQKFQVALDKLQDAIPWLAARVYSRTGSQNEAKLVLNPSDKIDFLISNLRDMMPSYSELAAQRMPQYEMKQELVSQMGLTPDRSTEYSPAFVLQANFIKGGLLLTIAAHHCVVDGTSIGLLIDALARLYSGHDLSQEEIQSFHPIEGRMSLFSQYSDSNGLDDHPPNPVAERQSQTDQPSRPIESVILNSIPQYEITDRETTIPYPTSIPDNPSISVKLFHVTSASLLELKRVCTPLTGSSSSTWVSTNDALCALIWTSINRARHLHKTAAQELISPSPLLSPSTPNNTTNNPPNNFLTGNSTLPSDPIPLTSTLMLPVNIRTRSSPPFPTKYLGCAYLDTLSHVPLTPLLTSLQNTALYLRKTINQITSSYITQTLSMFAEAEGKKIVRTPGFDILITSWVDQPSYSVEFEPELGRAEWVRTPRSACFNGICHIMPRSEEGVEVGMQLFETDMKRLEGDKWWMKWISAISN